MNFEANQHLTHLSDRDRDRDRQTLHNIDVDKRVVSICGLKVSPEDIAQSGAEPTCPGCLSVVERRENRK